MNNTTSDTYVAWNQAPQWGEKGKKLRQIGNILYFFPFSHNSEPGPRLILTLMSTF